MQQVDHSSASD